MHLQFVGCGDAFGTGGRFNTCFHLVGNNINALIDCGGSSLVGMNKLAIDRNAISTIFITHFHADHIGGLPFFILEANYVLKRKGALTIAGPPGLKSRFAEVMESAYPGTANLQLAFPLTLREVEIGKRNEIGNVQATPIRVVHDERAGPCLGYRCEAEGKIVSYSGDTQWTDAVIDIGRNADLFICEAYTRDKPINTHMALSALERHLPQIKPKRLILTHMSNDMLARRAEVPYESAEDGMIVEL
ncbi:MAG TPA: MBL fold metallo-hydrolase [Xanthobacteraceae bacterium]|nr:MBL fold metallo-hydrolase [Xanthobacteraceae bacterium]